ncbi:MAG: LUD domain-containing protein [Oscillospiraceae bacterium]|jgi:L-lactate utilization protein LutB|nr:LUD domain-containing protein [Oscillospiraceae bacterium]MCI8715704.1 LUD domain-containing protein [Oscillospiraceae bacterium]MCI9317283.1 LUD domain-containing protein [Oscillospiraceae bacterium]MDE6936330.1 lactate utilization protein [Oscillospiraceae bacterium]
MPFENLKKQLEANGFTVSVFASGEDAASYLNREIDGKTVGMGGSMTITGLGLKESLGSHNTLYSHGFTPGDPAEVQKLAADAEIYLLSANAIAEDTGEILNIDGTGNRAASSLYGHKKVYFVAGKNKVSPDFHSALHRLRNVVAPKNAQRLGRRTPCAAKGDRCYNCNSPERICRGLVVHYRKMNSMDMEVVLIDQELGY